jgi:hypothetical protein
MTDLALELRHLAQSEGHIAAAEAIVARQQALVEATRRVRFDARAEEHVLRLFEESLAAFRQHRGLILLAIRDATREA